MKRRGIDGLRNKFEVRGEITIIFLDKDKQTVIDTEDLERLTSFCLKWHACYDECSKSYYVKGSYHDDVTRKNVSLHRFITDAPRGMLVDHFDGNTLDNRKSNLKIVTPSENIQNGKTRTTNKSGTRNVCWIKNVSKWRVRIKGNNKVLFNKHYHSFDEAVEVANRVRSELIHCNPNRVVS